MAVYAVINSSTNIVQNIIEWDGVSEWTPPNESFVELLPNGVAIGFVYDPATGQFTDPNPPPPPSE
jgi:hypothetical protein